MDVHDWENVKENIQPLREGRKVQQLANALNPKNKEQIDKERQQFETELRTYDGPDPLDVWSRYVTWTVQNFPSGGKQSKLAQLVEKCILELQQRKDYYSDKRFLEIWLRYANYTAKPLETLEFMEKKKIGVTHAKFYITWAWVLEHGGLFKKANQVFAKGIEREAQPIEELQEAMQKFHMRIGKMTCQQIAEGEELGAPLILAPASSEVQRKALSSLKVDSKSRIGSSRAAILNDKENQLQFGLPARNAEAKIEVFEDHSDGILPSYPDVSQPNLKFQTKEERHKENIMKAGKWTKSSGAKLTLQKPTLLPKSPFKVYADPPSPGKKFPFKERKNLNVLREKKQEDKVPLALFEPYDPMVRPMYPKDKVYVGTEEFSLEELKALEYYARIQEQKELMRKEEEKREAERLRLLHLKEEEEKRKSSLKETDDQALKKENNGEEPPVVSSIEPDQDPATIFLNVSQAPTSSPTLHTKQAALLVDKLWNGSLHPNSVCSQPSISESLVTSPRPSAKTSKDITVFQDPTETLPKFPPATPPPSDEGEEPSAVASIQPGQDPATSFLNTSPAPTSSPTLHTKQAALLMDKLWNGSLHPNSVCSQPSISESLVTSPGPSAKPSKDITVFQDPTETLPKFPPATPPPSDEELLVFQEPINPGSSSRPPLAQIAEPIPQPQQDQQPYNDENVPPPDFVAPLVKRKCTGILVPSVDIPIAPIEPEVEEDGEKEDNEEAPLIHNQEAEDNNPTCTIGPLKLDDMTALVDELPNNTVSFMCHAKITSTPFVPCQPKLRSSNDQNYQTPENEGSDDMTIKNLNIKPRMPSEGTVFQPNEVPSWKQPAIINPIETLPPKIDTENIFPKPTSRPPSNFSTKEESPSLPAGLLPLQDDELRRRSFKPNLSDITEQSNEDYTSSSNSASSTASLMRSHYKSAFQKKIEEESVPALESIAVFEGNPFAPAHLEELLGTKLEELYQSPGLHRLSTTLPKMLGSSVKLGTSLYHIDRVRGKGAYSKVFKAKLDDGTGTSSNVALKVVKETHLWEFYICRELEKRIHQYERPCMMQISDAYLFTNGQILVSDFVEFGTLLDLANVFKTIYPTVPEILVVYFGVELLWIVHQLHQGNIIHADIKPDNFLIRDIPNGDTGLVSINGSRCLQLIDFGRAIDLSLYPPGTTFKYSVETEDFKCPEMLEGRPWTYQTDLYGVLACIHILLFSDYMKVTKSPATGQWGITKKFKRYWQVSIWKQLFSELLNVPNCRQFPDLEYHINQLEKHLKENMSEFKQMTSILCSHYKV